jgi:hypothetical protein
MNCNDKSERKGGICGFLFPAIILSIIFYWTHLGFASICPRLVTIQPDFLSLALLQVSHFAFCFFFPSDGGWPLPRLFHTRRMDAHVTWAMEKKHQMDACSWRLLVMYDASSGPVA